MANLSPSKIFSSKKPFLLVATFFFLSISSLAQERCGTVPYTEKLKKSNLLNESNSDFEQWLSRKISARKQALDADGRVETTTYQVPVVIHIIHNGEAVGTGTNIPDAQILSQITVLNNDFQRLNADAVNTPAEFTPVAGSMSIEFVLAKQDPNGNATNGIVRVKGTKTSWSSDDNYTLKGLSYWPAEDYLNIWVCNLSDYLGYTQFPVSSLPGLEDASNNRLTDGLVIGNLYFGTIDAGSFNLALRYNKGRTVTHEMGHFFGLRHIWGDEDNCAGTDYVNDTPNQNGNTGGCPSTPQPSCTSGVHKMFQNYLDYTDDACMNLFTNDQVSRMITVLSNSPRRVSLPTSHGLANPVPVANDLSISNIVSPHTSECNLNVTPTIEILNKGTNAITTASVQLLINSNPVETKSFSGNLNPGDSTTLVFSPQVRAAGTTNFTFDVISVNGAADGNSFNNSRSISTVITLPITTPFTENFNVLPTNWTIQNADQLTTWTLKTAPDADPNNKAIYIDYYDYNNHAGELDILISPPFDLSNTPIAFLTFDVAYAQFNKDSYDGLKVIVLTDCGTDLSTGTEVYNKTGNALATVANTTSSFTPKNASDWRAEVINLNSFIGHNRVRLAFVGTNGYGNNLYLDDVSIITTSFNDLAIGKVLNPAIVTCPTPSPRLTVTNVGTTTITNFNIQYSVNSGTALNTPVSGLNLSPGEQTEVDLPAVTLNTGSNSVSFSITNPNTNGIDINPGNSQTTVKTFVSTAADRTPLRENFDDDTANNWTIINPSNGTKWKTTSTNYNTSAYFSSSQANDQAWLVSPLLDFSRATEASIFFDLSYVWNGSTNASEQLQVLGSVGCGNVFDQVLFDNSGADLANTSSVPPRAASDWKRNFIDLSALAGQSDVRIAFVATHVTGSSNAIYIDNIEFYNSNNANPPTITGQSQYAIYTNPGDPVDFYITFNLAKKEAVGIDVVDIMGRPVISDILGDVLNETYPVTLNDSATGIYIVRLRTAGQYSATKVFVSK